MEGWDGGESVATPVPMGHGVRMKERRPSRGGKEKEEGWRKTMSESQIKKIEVRMYWLGESCKTWMTPYTIYCILLASPAI